MRSIHGVPKGALASNDMIISQISGRFQQQNTFAFHLIVALAMTLPLGFWSGREGFVYRSALLPLFLLPLTLGITDSFVLGFVPYAKFSVITIVAIQIVGIFLMAKLGRADGVPVNQEIPHGFAS